MAKKNGNNRFEKAQFYNAEFYDGNTRNQFRGNAIKQITNASEQTKGQLEGLTDATIEAYTVMYGQIANLHTEKYLKVIGKNERDHYDRLFSKNDSNSIYRKYDAFYSDLEQRHKQYLKNITMPDFDAPSEHESEAARTSNKAVQFATETTLVSIKETLEKIQENIKYSGGSGSANPEASANAGLLRGIAKDTDSMTKEEREQSRRNQEIARSVLNLYSSVSNNLVQGKTNSQILGGISNSLSAWIQGGPWAALGTALMQIVNSLTQFFGQAITTHWQTMEESFSNYGVYTKRWNDQYAGYTQDIIEKQDLLYDLELNDNIKSSEWMKKQIELSSKGLDSSTANSAAIQDIILNKIAPHLDTSSNIFMDFQQRGLVDIVHSLGGIVESVRNISGSSRVTQASLSTMIEQLGPVELYAKKNLLTGKAAAALSALEQAGMTTEDAMKVVSTVSGVISHPGSALTGGTTMERLLSVALSSGQVSLENAVPELISQYLGYANVFTGNVPTNQPYTAMLRDVVNSAVGIALSPYADTSDLYTVFSQYYNLYKDTTQEPESAYRDLYNAFESGFFQTADQRLEIIADNSILVAGANGFLHQISEWTLGIYEEITHVTDLLFTMTRTEEDKAAREAYKSIMSDTSLTEVERTKQLQEYLGTHKGYSNETAQKFIDAMYTSESAKDYTGSYLETLKKYSQSEYEKAVLSDVAYQTQLWKNLYEASESSGYSVGLSTYGIGGTGQTWQYNKTITLPESYVGGKTGTQKEIAGVDKHYATGGYVDSPEIALIGEGRDPELVTPVPQLVAAVSRGINSSSRMKSDYTEIISTINSVGNRIVQAIKDNNVNQIVLNPNTGLMSGTSVGDRVLSNSSLQPRMTRG